MKRINVKNYKYAGLDFIFDRDGTPWFLEANRSARGSRNMLNIYGEAKPLIHLSNFLNSKNMRVCMLVSDMKHVNGKENSWWVASKLENMLKVDFYKCPISKNRRRRKRMKTINNEFVRPQIIFRWGFRTFTKCFDKKALVINPQCVWDIVDNKYKTTRIIRKNTNIKVPKNYIIRNKKELEQELEEKKELFEDGFVIKPINGSSYGRGVKVYDKYERPKKIKSKCMLEQRIIPRLKNRMYWDVRVFVINGELAGAEIRKSKHRVTNIARGGHAEKVPKSLMKKVKKPALKVVKTIDKASQQKGFVVN